MSIGDHGAAPEVGGDGGSTVTTAAAAGATSADVASGCCGRRPMVSTNPAASARAAKPSATGAPRVATFSPTSDDGVSVSARNALAGGSSTGDVL